jgi:hypothetical protein
MQCVISLPLLVLLVLVLPEEVSRVVVVLAFFLYALGKVLLVVTYNDL